MPVGLSAEDQLAADLRAALAAHDTERARELLNGVLSTLSRSSKRVRDAYLWDIWRRAGAVKPPDLPPFRHGPPQAQSDAQILSPEG